MLLMMTAPSSCRENQGDLFYDEEVSHSLKLASHLPDRISAGIGTLTFVRLPRLQRAGPSASLDKNVSIVIRFSVRRSKLTNPSNTGRRRRSPCALPSSIQKTKTPSGYEGAA